MYYVEDRGTEGPGHYQQSRHEPELDKTPTNEAGRMLDLLEKVHLHIMKFSSTNITYTIPAKLFAP